MREALLADESVACFPQPKSLVVISRMATRLRRRTVGEVFPCVLHDERVSRGPDRRFGTLFGGQEPSPYDSDSYPHDERVAARSE